MSYLYPLTSSSGYGVVEVGANINVTSDGIISIAQDVGPNAHVSFGGISTGGNITANNFTTTGTTTTGSLVVTGNETDAGNLTVTGNIYGGEVFSNGLPTVTSVTPTANVGISLSNVVTGGPSAGFQINNTGVLSLLAGTGIVVSNATGNITISATGATVINTKGVSTNYTLTNSDDYVGATTGSITLTLPPGTVGQSFIIKNEGGSGACTVAASGTDTIDGSATKSLNSNASITVVYRAGAWRII